MKQTELIKGLAHLGEPHFLESLSILRRAGLDLRANGASARAWCEARARQGHAEAQYVLAELLIAGLFDTSDQADAYRMCEAAAQREFAPAVLLLAGFYESGWAGIRRDAEKARVLTEEAIDKGYAPAMRLLGLSLLDSQVHSDAVRGEALLEAAEEAGDGLAKTLRADRVLKKSTDPVELNPALDSLREAAASGEPLANRLLGYIYLQGSHGVAANSELAETFFDRASDFEERRWRDLI